jgi:predicted transposase/invertase (TIGR01784 family)
MLEKWILFIKETGMKGKEKKMEELIESEEVLKMAAQKIKELSKDEQMRQRYLARQKALMDKRSAERYREILLERATMNGIQKGRLEERVETAREGIKIGLDIKTIKKLTKLSEEEIRNILKESGKK